ncbi:probable G-protein coupled receptor 34 [Girardinichthys multiradiatus]|uniref:probable G-protein coupled receptor 34 n=1 Tax=Girardinichthys multiradiatus TaxID=208333 RepID=UPI001FAB945B|nr:probable G-protein coupled receptor 34 [Girardinichthys multiradiatus]
MLTLEPPNSSQASVTNTSDTDNCVDNKMLQMPLVVLYSIIFILGLIGNLLALWVFFFVRSKRNSMRVFLINLALADLLLAICLPFRIQYHLQKNQWKMWPWLCKTVGYFFYMNMYISITLLGLISVDRYLRIYGSAGTRNKLQSPTWSIAVCVIIWMVALAIMLPFVITKSHSTTMCFHYRNIEKEDMWKVHINIIMLAVFWLVFICLMVSYGKIAQKLFQRSQDCPHLPTAPHYSQVARKSFFILFLFVVCFVPYHIIRGFYITTQINNVSCVWKNLADKLNETSLVFSALNSCLDPVMFFLLSGSVRKEMRRFMRSVFRVRSIGRATELNSKNNRIQSNVRTTSNANEKETASSSSV